MNARIPIELASHEQKQLDEFQPRMVDRLDDIGLDEEADEIDDVTIVDEQDGTFSATTEEWVAIISGLRVLRDDEGLRTWWLRKKLARRLSDTVDELEADEADESDVTPGVQAGETTTQEGVSA